MLWVRCVAFLILSLIVVGVEGNDSTLVLHQNNENIRLLDACVKKDGEGAWVVLAKKEGSRRSKYKTIELWEAGTTTFSKQKVVVSDELAQFISNAKCIGLGNGVLIIVEQLPYHYAYRVEDTKVGLPFKISLEGPLVAMAELGRSIVVASENKVLVMSPDGSLIEIPTIDQTVTIATSQVANQIYILGYRSQDIVEGELEKLWLSRFDVEANTYLKATEFEVNVPKSMVPRQTVKIAIDRSLIHLFAVSLPSPNTIDASVEAVYRTWRKDSLPSSGEVTIEQIDRSRFDPISLVTDRYHQVILAFAENASVRGTPEARGSYLIVDVRSNPRIRHQFKIDFPIASVRDIHIVPSIENLYVLSNRIVMNDENRMYDIVTLDRVSYLK